ncbi:uncharacterized protein HMPREF1120_02175 [Exophiala dermatitidis NIH/UT8656]|uniref:Uncharacterized protein n=1 Tax=Exophiala dermatitidis (strain ATCC 34100 / CBS 525.76 / NIH/UT8656) TaxID=858893 RepID=H6BRJ3_EXODN|nr:uncharacterized protein HMPREF1120_02175 [Exophiala dermatitidis NIH/UT8656]EHY53998.1 hypothetical protein HMPREF1120_02175 [Exophiala dermatitidis NIH/UT8656]
MVSTTEVTVGGPCAITFASWKRQRDRQARDFAERLVGVMPWGGLCTPHRWISSSSPPTSWYTEKDEFAMRLWYEHEVHNLNHTSSGACFLSFFFFWFESSSRQTLSTCARSIPALSRRLMMLTLCQVYLLALYLCRARATSSRS